MNRRDALKALAALPLAGGLAHALPAAECDCGCSCEGYEIIECTIGPCSCGATPVNYFTLSNPAGDEVRYEFADGWYRPVGAELLEGFPKGFRWGDDLRIEEMEAGVGIVQPCCGA